MVQVQNAIAPDEQDELSGVILQATNYVVQGVGQMHPALAIAALIGAIERISAASDQQFVMSVSQMLDDSAAGLRSAAIAGGAPQIEVAR